MQIDTWREDVLVLAARVYHFFATVESVGAHVVTTVNFTGSLVYRQGGSGQRIV
jgi:hypothetical protein